MQVKVDDNMCKHINMNEYNCLCSIYCELEADNPKFTSFYEFSCVVTLPHYTITLPHCTITLSHYTITLLHYTITLSHFHYYIIIFIYCYYLWGSQIGSS